MTRAKDQLHLIVPQRFYTHGQRSTGDRHVYASRSRFIPDSALQHFECTAWPRAQSSEAGRNTGTPQHSIDVRSRLKAIWR
jgi:DNA helicase II / ATP-dependent DNA helicase PcrA